MTTILGLAERLLAQGGTHRVAGRHGLALRCYRRAARLELPARHAEEAHGALAEIYEQAGDFAKARRHLHAAMTVAPRSAAHHHRLAVLLEMDETAGDLERAARHHAKAVKLEPQEADYRRDYGLCLLALGKRRAGLGQLEKAAELKPDDLENVRVLAVHLAELDRPNAARRVLMAARFRHRGSPAYQQVRERVEFALARRRQEADRRAVTLTFDEPAKILPFLAPVRPLPPRPQAGPILRFDGPSTSSPHVPRPARFRQFETN